MQTKSNIQIIRENLALRENFANNIKSFMDKYTIEDSYFGISGGASSTKESMTEYINGYFVMEHEYTNIDDAISNMAPNQVIRIIENNRFQIGERYRKLSEVEGDNVIDISTGASIS